MSTALAKVQRLLESDDDGFTAQGAELVLTLADPDIDGWVLSTVRMKDDDDPKHWGRAPAPTVSHRRLPRSVVYEVIARNPGWAAPPRLFVEGHREGPLDVTGFATAAGVTELIVRAGSFYASTWSHWALRNRSRLIGVEALAGTTGLVDLLIVGADELDLAPLVANPSLRRLSVLGSTVAAGALDLRGSALERLDLDQVPGLTGLTVPAGLRELHVRRLPDLTGIDGLAAAARCTDVSCVDTPALTTCPQLPPAARRIRFTAPGLTSIAPLAGRPLDDLDLTGCAALDSLEGFPTVLGGQLSLNGCTSVTDLAPLAGCRADGVRVVDLRGATRVDDLAPVTGWAGVGVIALHGTGTRPESVPTALLPACTWAGRPDLGLLGARAARPA